MRHGTTPCQVSPVGYGLRCYGLLLWTCGRRLREQHRSPRGAQPGRVRSAPDTQFRRSSSVGDRQALGSELGRSCSSRCGRRLPSSMSRSKPSSPSTLTASSWSPYSVPSRFGTSAHCGCGHAPRPLRLTQQSRLFRRHSAGKGSQAIRSGSTGVGPVPSSIARPFTNELAARSERVGGHRAL